MSKQDLARFDEEHLATWDAHDADAFVSLFADEFVWYDWTQPEPIRDRETAKQYFSSWATAFPDLKTTEATRVVGDDAVATEIEWSGTNTGPMMMGGKEIPPTNKSVIGRGSYIFRVKAGKIVEFRSHPDVAGIMMQLGFMPPM